MSRTIGIVGCGSIGTRHLANLVSLEVHDVVVADPDPVRRKEAVLRGAGAAFPGLEAMLEARTLDALLVCSPTTCHVDHGLVGAEAGVPLFVEKPLATDAQDPTPLLEATRRRGVPLFVGMVYRFHDGLRRLKALLEGREVGKIQFATFHGGHYLPDWRPGRDYRNVYSARPELGGGVLLDSIHALDLVRWLIGQPTRVSAFVQRTGDLDLEVDDLVSAILEVDTGPLVEVHVDYLQRAKEDSILVSGTEGSLRWDFVAGELRCFAPGQGWGREDFSTDTNRMYVEEMRAFLRVLDGDDEPFVDGDDALATLRLVRSIRASAATGRVVEHAP